MDQQKLFDDVRNAFCDVEFLSKGDRDRCITQTIRSALPNARRSLVLVAGRAMSGKSTLIERVALLCGFDSPGSWLAADDFLCKDADFKRGLAAANSPFFRVTIDYSGRVGCSALATFLTVDPDLQPLSGGKIRASQARPPIWCELNSHRRPSVHMQKNIWKRTAIVYLKGFRRSSAQIEAAKNSLTALRSLGLPADEIDTFLAPFEVLK